MISFFPGWATDLKLIDPKIIHKRADRTGDGSFIDSRVYLDKTFREVREEGKFDEHIWGWQDEMISQKEKENVTIINQTESS